MGKELKMRHVLSVELSTQLGQLNWSEIRYASEAFFAEILHTFPGLAMVCAAVILTLALISVRIDAYLSDKRSAICKAKWERSWSGTTYQEGEISPSFFDEVRWRQDPLLAEISLSDGRQFLARVSPLFFSRLIVGQALPRRVFRRMLRQAV